MSYQSEHTQNIYKPYLAADIDDTLEVSFDDFLQTAFDLPANWEDDPQLVDITTTLAFRKLLSVYATKVEDETGRYHPFNTLANYIIAQLGEESSLVFCRNDPVLARGSSAGRKPDSVVVQPSALQINTRISWDSLSEKGPGLGKYDAFYWHEILAFCVIKLKKLDLTSYLSVSSTGATPATNRPTGSSSSRRTGSLKGKEKASASKAASFPPHVPEKRTASGASSISYLLSTGCRST